MNFVAIDFETANYKHTSICQIGIAVFENGQMVESKSLFVKPYPNYFEKIHIEKHGILPEMVKDKPTFKEVWDEISSHFENKEIVAHNASFDMSALRHTLTHYNIPFPKLNYYCSMFMSKNLVERMSNYQLSTLCKNFNIPLNHHEAESDAIAAGLLSIELCKIANTDSLGKLSDVLNFRTGKLLDNDYIPFSTQTKSKSNFSNWKKPNLDLLEEPSETNTEHPFFGKQVVFTGVLTGLSRQDAMQMVVNAGGIIKSDSLTQKTNYLVLGTDAYNDYEKGILSGKIEKAEKYIQNGFDIEIISEKDFFGMIHMEKTKFEVTLQQIEKNSALLLERNKYNEFSNKSVFFTKGLLIDRLKAFQLIGNCGGYGHDYDLSPEVEFIVFSEETLEKLSEGFKTQDVLEIEEMRNKAQNRGEVIGIKLISESVFYKYMNLRESVQKGEFKMNFSEQEVIKQLNAMKTPTPEEMSIEK